jgi:hypothetical protein
MLIAVLRACPSPDHIVRLYLAGYISYEEAWLITEPGSLYARGNDPELNTSSSITACNRNETFANVMSQYSAA